MTLPTDLDAAEPQKKAIDIHFSSEGAWSPSAIAVDWIGNNLYVVDSLGQKVNLFDMDGLYSAIVVTSNLTSPVDIALDPLMGVMFITDNNRVVRANMDGTHLIPLGMISHKKSLITNFGHMHKIKNFIKTIKTFDIFHKQISIAFDFDLYLE